MSEDIVNNNPKKEFVYALGGTALFLGIVLLIGISGFLRPAGQHVTVDNAETPAVAEEAQVAAEDTTAETSTEVAVATEEADEVGADTADTATDDAVIATVEPAAAANDPVDQAAVADADLTAEQTDGDLVADPAEEATAAQ